MTLLWGLLLALLLLLSLSCIFFMFLKIYLSFLFFAVLSCCAWAFSNWGELSVVVRGLPIEVTSLVAALGF